MEEDLNALTNRREGRENIDIAFGEAHNFSYLGQLQLSEEAAGL